MFPRNGTPGGPGGRRFRLRAAREMNSWYNAYKITARRDVDIVVSMLAMFRKVVAFADLRFLASRFGSNCRVTVVWWGCGGRFRGRQV